MSEKILESEYDRFAALYDEIFRGQPGDIEFYVSEAKKVGSVLEIGCGTGRITIPIARAGVSIVGMDISRQMLEIANKKALAEGLSIPWIQADMRNFIIKRKKFDLVIIPYRTFLHALTVEEQKATLANIYRILKKGGRLIINFFVPDYDYIVKGMPKEPIERKVDRKSGIVTKTYQDVVFDRYSQVNKTNIYVARWKSGKKLSEKKYRFYLRYIFRYEGQHLFELCGYRIAALYGDFDRTAFGRKSEEMIWVLEKR